MKKYVLSALLVLGACAHTTRPAPPTRLAAPVGVALPNMQSFAASSARARGAQSRRPNAEIAQDFMDLSFTMESGRKLTKLTRFETPISVRLTGRVNALMAQDLRQLLARLRSEAGIDIFMSAAPGAQITVEAIPRATLRAAVPRAACFVVPRVGSWSEYLANRNTSIIDWTTLNRRDRATIFLPADAAPQEIRDCLHEELAQALGPLNDLYRLPDSVFNDDNIHAVLTGFDMLILRATYAPELANGMSRDEVAARLPGILARINPAGQTGTARPAPRISRAWISAMETALEIGRPNGTRIAAATRALDMARAQNMGGNRSGFAHYAFGRLQVGRDPHLALHSFQTAHNTFVKSPLTQIHSAYSAAQLSAFALSSGQAQKVVDLTTPAIQIARQHQNAALLASLQMFRAEANDLLGRSGAADRDRMDSLSWARYGFGSDANVQARMREIASLSPKR